MLETFNGLRVEYKDGDTYKYKKIPIKYSTREKLNLFDEVEEQNLLSGNYNVLPRTTIALTTIVKNMERQSNKFNKIVSTEFGEFMFNAVAYDFTYDMSIMCRGMNEASMVIEQITSRFNPTYTVLINEISGVDVPTSVPIMLLDVGIEGQEYDELSNDIITVSIGLMLKGNFYAPIENMEKIKHVDMFLNMWHHDIKNEYNRAKLYKYDVIDSVLQPTPEEHVLVRDDGEFTHVDPVIIDIIAEDGEVNEEIPVKCEVTDYDNKMPELEFIWSSTGNTRIEGTGYKVTLTGQDTEIVEIKCIVVDVHGNRSNMFIKTISII